MGDLTTYASFPISAGRFCGGDPSWCFFLQGGSFPGIILQLLPTSHSFPGEELSGESEKEAGHFLSFCPGVRLPAQCGEACFLGLESVSNSGVHYSDASHCHASKADIEQCGFSVIKMLFRSPEAPPTLPMS